MVALGSINQMSNTKPIYLRVIKGGFVPADNQSAEALREKKFAVGDVVKAVIKKIRNPKFNRLVHNIGKICANNIEEFSGKSAHEVIKQIQIDGDICCEKQAVDVPGFGKIEVRRAESISFDNMSEDEFQDLALRMCRYVSENYWQGCTEEQIMDMAEKFIDE